MPNVLSPHSTSRFTSLDKNRYSNRNSEQFQSKTDKLRLRNSSDETFVPLETARLRAVTKYYKIYEKNYYLL